MGQQDKLIAKFKTSSNNFSWQELTKLLTGLGFESFLIKIAIKGFESKEIRLFLGRWNI